MLAETVADEQMETTTLTFTNGALDGFIDLINGAHIVKDGLLFEFKVDKVWPGEGYMTVTTHRMDRDAE